MTQCQNPRVSWGESIGMIIATIRAGIIHPASRGLFTAMIALAAISAVGSDQNQTRLSIDRPRDDSGSLGLTETNTAHITSVSELRQIIRTANDSPANDFPIKTYRVIANLVHAAPWRAGAFFQEGGERLYVRVAPGSIGPLLSQSVGCRVKITGQPTETQGGQWHFLATSFEVIDPDHRIQAVPAKIESATVGTPLGRLGYVKANVREVMVFGGRTHLYLNTPNGAKLRCMISQPTNEKIARRWVLSDVRVTGCVGYYSGRSSVQPTHEISMMGHSQVTVLDEQKAEKEQTKNHAVPIRQTDPFAKKEVRVTLDGLVVYTDGVSELVVASGGQRYRVRSRLADSLRAGVLVHLEGKNVWENDGDVHLVRSQIMTVKGQMPLPPTRETSVEDLFLTSKLPTRVTVVGRVTRSQFNERGHTLVFDDSDSGRDLRASISFHKAEMDGAEFSIKPNSLVRVTGVPIRCKFTGPDRTTTTKKSFVSLMVGSPADVTVIESPVFLSFRQALMYSGLLVLSLGSVLAWNYSLRRQVDARTKRLTVLSNRMQTAFEAMREAVLITDVDGNVVQANRRFQEIFALDPSQDQTLDALNATLRQRFDSSEFTDALTHSLETASTLSFPAEMQLRGRKVFLQVYSCPIKATEQNPKGQLYVFEDLTAEQLLQAKLVQSQKMEAVGQLSGGIAHDFNNYLSVIGASIAAIEVQHRDVASSSLDSAKLAVNRAAGLTQQLLGFARRSRLDRTVVPVRTLIDEVASLMSGVIESPVQFSTNGGPAHLCVDVDVNHIEQVLINLCLNAYDAVSKTTGTIHLSADLESGSGWERRVCIRVTDNGRGITDEDRRKIFEPFFTTKDVGQGTGLGLAVAQGVIEQHGGEIEVESQLGEGTEFRVLLPLAKRTNPKPEAAFSQSQDTKRLRILVVDDDRLVRSSISALLSSLSHTVIEAENGMQAIAQLSDNSQIDLILMDMTMPEMSGWETYHEIKSAWPKHRVVFCSGHASEKVRQAKNVDEECPEVLQKPLRTEDLKSLLLRVADSLPKRA